MVTVENQTSHYRNKKKYWKEAFLLSNFGEHSKVSFCFSDVIYIYH